MDDGACLATVTMGCEHRCKDGVVDEASCLVALMTGCEEDLADEGVVLTYASGVLTFDLERAEY